MLFSILRGNYSAIQILASLFSLAFVVFCTLPIHEFAHAWVATKLGDDTPRLSGRLTINPMAHLDPIGAILILVAGFGYAKPVQINPRNFKNPKAGMAITALAGPISNLLMAVLFIFLMNVCTLGYSGSVLAQAFYMFFYFAASINISLAVFNLIPIPPLDGSRVLQLLIPNKYYYQFMKYERYIIIVVFVLIFFGAFNRPLSFLQNLLFDGINYIFRLIF